MLLPAPERGWSRVCDLLHYQLRAADGDGICYGAALQEATATLPVSPVTDGSPAAEHSLANPFLHPN